MQKIHLQSQILGDKEVGVKNTRKFIGSYSHIAFINVHQEIRDECWIKAIHEEVKKNEKSCTWDLLPRRKNKNVIGTKMIFKNKLNEYGNIFRNKKFLVYKGYA